MSKSINILDKEYVQWVKSLVERYRRSQIKAAIKVNTEQLRFNWLLGIEDAGEIRPQLEGDLSLQQLEEIFKVPWGHHKLILDKVGNSKALLG